MQKSIQIRNLHCAACALELSEELEHIEGISQSNVDFINQRVSFFYDNEPCLQKAIYAISHFEEVEIIDGNAPQKKQRYVKEIINLCLSAAFFIPALALQILGVGGRWLPFALFLASFISAGWTVAFSVGKNIVKTFTGGFHLSMLFDENLLMLLAAVGAFCVGENMEGGAVMLLYQTGELLQTVAVASSRKSIAKLLELKSDSAILLENGVQKEVSPSELSVGEMIFIRKGDKIPVDCTLLEGEAQLDTKSLTGEAYLKEVSFGEEMLSGCVNVGEGVKAKVIRPLSQSAAQKILEMVEQSSQNKAKPEKFITKFARIYTPVVVFSAILVAILPPLFLGMTAELFRIWLLRALNFLVISCPCALVISVPLTYFLGVGALAKQGVLAKGAVHLDTLSKTQVVAFDKTGTLTQGKFSVYQVHGEERVLSLASVLEQASSHPLSQAFAHISCNVTAQNVQEITGKGLKGVVDGKEVLVGSAKLLCEEGIAFVPAESNYLVVYVVEGGVCLGYVELQDSVRKEAKEGLTALKENGIKRIAVLTGDSESRAKVALQGLPVDEIYANLLPEQKVEKAKMLKEDALLLYVGDGINDAPVMAESDLAVAMGALGSDAAIEASDFVLATDCLSALPLALKGAKKTGKIVKQNIMFSIAIKVGFMALSLLGLLPLWAAVFGDVGVMLLAVLNSLRMRRKLRKKEKN